MNRQAKAKQATRQESCQARSEGHFQGEAEAGADEDRQEARCSRWVSTISGQGCCAQAAKGYGSDAELVEGFDEVVVGVVGVGERGSK